MGPIVVLVARMYNEGRELLAEKPWQRLTPHKKADKLAIHGSFNLPYHEDENFFASRAQSFRAFTQTFVISQILIYGLQLLSP